MSLIVAVKDKDRFVIGCDTRMSGEFEYEDSYYRIPKARKSKKGMIIGAVGNIGILDVVEPILFEMESISRSSLLKTLVLPLFNCLRGTPFLNHNNELDADLIVAYKDKCFEISSIGTITEVNNFNCIGSGANTAFGSLFSTVNTGKSVEERIKLAIEATSAHITSVSNQCWVADTKDKKFTRI